MGGTINYFHFRGYVIQKRLGTAAGANTRRVRNAWPKRMSANNTKTRVVNSRPPSIRNCNFYVRVYKGLHAHFLRRPLCGTTVDEHTRKWQHAENGKRAETQNATRESACTQLIYKCGRPVRRTRVVRYSIIILSRGKPSLIAAVPTNKRRRPVRTRVDNQISSN